VRGRTLEESGRLKRDRSDPVRRSGNDQASAPMMRAQYRSHPADQSGQGEAVADLLQISPM